MGNIRLLDAWGYPVAVWNDRRTPPGQMTHLSVQMGAQYAMPKETVDPDRHTMATGVKGTKPKPPPKQPRQFGKTKS